MLSIIIPTYNERENIERLIPEIFSVFSKNKIKGEVIIVDDNSPDETYETAKTLSKKYDVKVIKRKGKLGLSSAVLEGFEKAKYDTMGVMDADFSHPPKTIPLLFDEIRKGRADIAIGSRHIHGGGIENWSLKRKIISKCAALLARGLTSVKDPMSGFFFLNRKIIKDVKLNSKGFKILLEILVKGNYKNIKEVPFVFVDRKSGKSKMGKHEIWNYFRHALGLYKWKVKRRF